MEKTKLKTVPESLGRYKRVFNKQQEEKLVKLIKQLDSVFYGIIFKDMQRLCFQYVGRNN